MSDIFKETILDQQQNLPFSSKEWAFCQDAQGQNYQNGVVNLDLTNFAQSTELFTSFSEAILTIPLVLCVSTMDAAVQGFTADLANSYMANLKNHHNLIHNMTVTINQTQYSQACNFSNIPISFKLASTMNSNDLINLGPSIGFVKNTGNFKYNGCAANVADTTFTCSGVGENNNSIYTQSDTPQGGYSSNAFNSGRFLKCSQASYDITSTTNNSMLNQMRTQAQVISEQKNYFRLGTNPTSEVVYYILATIRMKDISSLFANLPLCRGCKVGLTIGTNANSYFTFSTSKGALAIPFAATIQPANAMVNPNYDAILGVVGHAATPQAQGILPTGITYSTPGTMPFMISGPAPMTTNTNNTGFNSVVAPVVGGVQQTISYTISLGIATINGVSYSHNQTAVKLWIPQYKLTPPYVSFLLDKTPTKRVIYTEMFQQTYSGANVAAVGQPQSYLFSGPVKNPKWVLVSPFIAATQNGITSGQGTFAGTACATPFSPLVSPFTSAGDTVSPYASLINFNIRVGNKLVFPQGLNYDWQMFQQEIRPAHSMNSGEIMGLSSGLIGQNDWVEKGFGWYYVDLTKHIDSDINNSTTITVELTNNCSMPLDILVHVGVERSFDLSLFTGQIENKSF